jgi:hypothetical protein
MLILNRSDADESKTWCRNLPGVGGLRFTVITRACNVNFNQNMNIQVKHVIVPNNYMGHMIGIKKRLQCSVHWHCTSAPVFEIKHMTFMKPLLTHKIHT